MTARNPKPEDMTDDEGVAPEEVEEDLGIAEGDDYEALIAAAQASVEDMTLDLSEMIKPVPKGVYDLRFLAWEPDVSKEGKPMLKFTFEVVSPVEGIMGRKVVKRYMRSGKGTGFTVAILEAIGIGIDTETGQPVGLSAEALNKQRGTVITADLDIKNGFNEVVNPRPLG